ncbi:MAG: HD domain-containing protein [Anaerohalosphaeraceae bacterium]|nr:HD domain-containing protein [Anaerohalosphaeraceae bacterium]
MSHLFIGQLKPGVTIDGVYVVNQPILRSTTRGDMYIAMYLSDRTGRLNGRMWQASEAVYNTLPKEGFVHIKGRSEMYQSALQIVVNDIRVVSGENVNLEDYLPRTEKDPAEMFSRIEEMLSELKNPTVKALVGEFLFDEKLMSKFRKAPAATQNHHNYLGGLLEHTHNMLNVAKAIIPLYPDLQADLVIAGIFLHDMGKTKELSYEMAFGYTDSGQMLGHIVQTVMMVQQAIETLRAKGVEIDDSVVESIEHIILAHHGQYEFGSPKLPMTAEAFLVGYIDNIDAKMNQISNIIENEPGDADWTGYVRSLEAKLYRRRVVD